MSIVLSTHTNAQGLGNPIVNINFGEGKTNPGAALPSGYTDFSFNADSCPQQGTYTVTNSLYRCPSTRIGRSIDATLNSSYGYMMLVNDTPSKSTRILFIDSVRAALCHSTTYQFSAAFLNTNIPGYCKNNNLHFPSFTMKVETPTGQLIERLNTGSMPYDYDPVHTPKFHTYAINFVLPTGVDQIVLKIEDDAYTYPACAYSFAVDDIQLKAVGPDASIKFSNANGTELVKAVCYKDNKTITMLGTVGAYYTNTKYQWEQSIDDGQTWTDIPGATSLNYTNIFSTADTFLFRISAADASTIANSNCRVVSNILTVQVDDIPRRYSISSNSPVCAGSALQLNASGGSAYEWHGPNFFYDNVSYAQISRAVLADSGMYYITLYSYGGCSVTDSLHVKIIGSGNINAGPDTAICQGGSVRLIATGGSIFLWTPSAGLSSTSTNSPIAKPVVTTDYVVKVTDTFGCSDTAHVLVILRNKKELKAIISAQKFVCAPADSLLFTDASLGAVSQRYWSFGNGQIDTTSHPPLQYYFPNTNQAHFIAWLVIKDTAGCTDTTYHLITGESNCYIAVPSAFTPNGDGLNDYLYPLNAYKATDLVFMVFNRFGQLVFETKDWTRKWDGKLNDVYQPSGVYVWVLKYKDPSGKKISLKGTTTLIR